MKSIHTVLLGGMMAFALAACNTTDPAGSSSSGMSSSSSSGMSSSGASVGSGNDAMGRSTTGGTGAQGGTGNPTVDAQMGVTPTNTPAADGNASTPTNTGHTTTGDGK
jgi:hypothetical protein